ATLLSDQTKTLFAQDGYDLSRIQVQHLMSHTSGVWNYANQAYIDHKRENPNYRWIRDEQLQLTVEKGDPLGPPGSQFHYSDANYLLLTEIIETLTNLPFYVAMRSLLKYEELQLNHTWFPTLEEQPTGTKALAHQYRKSYDWDSYELDVSWDLYGGGGIACPTKDLARFVQSYFNGKIVANDTIRDLIFTEIPAKETEIYPYYLGLSQSNYHGMNAYGHGGFWATVMMYFPSINASIAVCVLEKDQGFLRRNILSTTSKLLLTEHNKRRNKNEQIAAYIAQLSDFSGSILVAHQDEVIQHQAYGLASREYEVKNTTDTKFSIASISKLITAVGVLQLVEEGKIALDEKVGTYLPEYPNAIIRDAATIQHLLTHTSGIPPFYGRDYLQSDKTSYQTINDFIPLFAQDSLRFLPGEQYQYSGSGFVVLGAIIEAVTGMDYYHYIDNHVFQQAGMQHSLAIPTDSIVPKKASGYTSFWGDQDYFSRNDFYNSKASPAGSHYSTTHDLFLFSKALRNGGLISAKTYHLLTTPQTKGYNTHIGYGIDIDQRYNERVIGHSGGWFGIR
ncbi:MAG: serine hydrolase domain-containing protein, partial [Bacteroidota bacterium]